MATTEAIIGAAAIAVCNIGLAGYLAGTVIHYCFARNAGRLKWIATGIVSMIALITLWVNLKAWEVRATLGVDPSLPTYQADLLVANLIGGAICVMGLMIAGYWFYRFSKSKDPYLAYGVLGDQVAELKAILAEPAAECRADLIALTRQTSAKLVALQTAGQEVIHTSEACVLKAEKTAQAFEQAQDGLISEYERVVNLARKDGRRILEQYTPDFFSTPADFTGLRRDPLSVDAIQDRHTEHKAAFDRLQDNLQLAETALEDTAEDLEQRLQTEFGG